METTTTMESIAIKRCKKCGRELPLSHFHHDSRLKDGLKNACKECQALYTRDFYAKKKEEKESTPLSKFTPRELIEELRRRGYKGKLQYVYEVVI